MLMERTAPLDPQSGVEDELDRLATMPIARLRVRFQEVFRTEPPKAFGRPAPAQHRASDSGGRPMAASPVRRGLLDEAMKAFAAKPNGKIVLPRRDQAGLGLVANGRASHRVMVLADGSPMKETFTAISPRYRPDHRDQVEGPRFLGLRPSARSDEPAAPDPSDGAKRKPRPCAARSNHLGGRKRLSKRNASSTGKSAFERRRHGANSIEPVAAPSKHPANPTNMAWSWSSFAGCPKGGRRGLYKSQASPGMEGLPQHYDDPAYSGGNLDRPALKKLLADIEAAGSTWWGYKRPLTRSLADFAQAGRGL